MKEYIKMVVACQGGIDGACSGGIVVRPNMVVTNSNITGDNGEIRIFDRIRSPVKLISTATIHKHDDAKGFCLLNAPGVQGTTAEIQQYVRQYDTLAVDEHVRAVFWQPERFVLDGLPNKAALYELEGTIVQLRESESVRYVRTDIVIGHSASGGGLFDLHGKLVGIINHKIVDADKDIAFAIPLDSVLDL